MDFMAICFSANTYANGEDCRNLIFSINYSFYNNTGRDAFSHPDYRMSLNLVQIPEEVHPRAARTLFNIDQAILRYRITDQFGNISRKYKVISQFRLLNPRQNIRMSMRVYEDDILPQIFTLDSLHIDIDTESITSNEYVMLTDFLSVKCEN